jgi:hypothetical protein
VFSAGQIAVTALVSGLVSGVFLVVYGRVSSDAVLRWSEVVVVAVVVGVSVLFWRLAGNVAPLNEDPIAFVSPNDVLCPVLTYVFLGVYAGFAGTPSHPRWARIRSGLTIISLIVNVVTI